MRRGVKSSEELKFLFGFGERWEIIRNSDEEKFRYQGKAWRVID